MISGNTALGIVGVLLGIAGLWLGFRGHRDLRLHGFAEFARDLIEELENLKRAWWELADLVAPPGAAATEQQLAALEDEYRFSLMHAREEAASKETPEYVRNLILQIPQLTRDNAVSELRYKVYRLLADSRSVLSALTDEKIWWRDARHYRKHGSAYPKDRPSMRWRLRRYRMRGWFEKLISKITGAAR